MFKVIDITLFKKELKPNLQKAFKLLALFCFHFSLIAQQDPASSIEEDYSKKIHPILKEFCFECHIGKEAEAEVNLESFKTITDFQRDIKTWIKVAEMLSSQQMPPKKSNQPSEKELVILKNWVNNLLVEEAKKLAGDPGRVVLRRLNSYEYNQSVRDLTGVSSLNPTHEFPVDGAAGEGFTNSGDALGMSSALINKFLDAGKAVARHTVLIPGNIRFSEHISERDRADELITRIRQFYAEFANINRQAGDTWDDSNQSKSNVIKRNGSIPLEDYFLATLKEREALVQNHKTIANIAQKYHLNEKYFQALWKMLNEDISPQGSILLNQIREQWRSTQDTNPKPLTQTIHQWQQALWRFDPIGHIGRKDGPTAWMNPKTFTKSSEDFSLKLSPLNNDQRLIVYLAANNAGGIESDNFVRWGNPRLTGGNKPDLSLRDIPGLADRLADLQSESLSLTSRYLTAVSKIVSDQTDLDTLANEYKLDPEILSSWLDYIGAGPRRPVIIEGLLTKKLIHLGGSEYVNGWGLPETPSVIANSSNSEYRIPGIARPRSVEVHPSPTHFVAVGWKSPTSGELVISAKIADAHVNCGNGGEWWVQHHTSRKLVNIGYGEYNTGGSGELNPFKLNVNVGDVIRLAIGPRNGSHACDLTHVDMTLTETGGTKNTWDISKDISGRILDGNPLKDRYGNSAVWHFYSGNIEDVAKVPHKVLQAPEGSLITKWLDEKDVTKRKDLAARIQSLADGNIKPQPNSPDAILLEHLYKITIPKRLKSLIKTIKPDPRFGKHPLGHSVESSDLIVRAPNIIELHIPSKLAEGRTLVVSGDLEPEYGKAGSVQISVGLEKPSPNQLSPNRPIITTPNSDTEKRIISSLNDFRNLFPASICYPQIVPVDEVVTMSLYFREDETLQRLMLNDPQKRELDHLWDELFYITKEPLKKEIAYEQIVEFSTQDRPDLVIAWKPYKPILMKEVAAFHARLLEDEQRHLDAVIEWAGLAWSRPLNKAEKSSLQNLYNNLRNREINHEEAIRLTITRILTSPAFLYRREKAGKGHDPVPVSSNELAKRLSYFLWSSIPDASLREVGDNGKLTNNDILINQTRRMLRDSRIRRLAEQFACQWLHIRDFDQNDDKNEQRFPEFATLRKDMYEESIRFFEDMFRNDGSVLDLLTADHTFLNERLAKHYGINNIIGEEWRRIDGMQAKGRGGVLGLATVLAINSGASRTSPILRGNWVYETLLGEKLPRPPADVPQLPESVPSGLTARQLIEKHSEVPECAKCHERIDPYGFALEEFDAIGRQRLTNFNSETKLMDGTQIKGLIGLRDHLATKRLDDVMNQFCRKLLGYALGREVALSDLLLIEKMKNHLEKNEYRFSKAIEVIILSPQFRKIRGRQTINQY